MEVKQIYTIVNTMAEEMLGESAIVQEDLSNIADIGNTFLNVVGVDNFVKALSDQIGRLIFVDRVYRGRVPSVMRDGWEYGSILGKIRCSLPAVAENESWSLTDGTSYDPNVFTQPDVSAKYWNKRTTFEVPLSYTERQVKSALASPAQLNAFMSMIYTARENAMTMALDNLIMATIRNLAAETIYADYEGAAFNSKSGVKAVNLLYLYNNSGIPASSITASAAMTDPEFIRFASKKIGEYKDNMAAFSTLLNVGGTEKFTPEDRLSVVMLSDFYRSAGAYLQSDTFNTEYTALPGAELVNAWQGSGTGFAFADKSKIYCKTADNHNVEISGVLGLMFDKDACGVMCENRRVTNIWNPKGEFFNEWYKADAQYFNDLDENCVVFFVA